MYRSSNRNPNRAGDIVWSADEVVREMSEIYAEVVDLVESYSEETGMEILDQTISTTGRTIHGKFTDFRPPNEVGMELMPRTLAKKVEALNFRLGKSSLIMMLVRGNGNFTRKTIEQLSDANLGILSMTSDVNRHFNSEHLL